VGEDGRLYWMMDAYVMSSRYPYSEPYFDSFNYIRNSVKIVINAYDGSPTFYVVDPSDPPITAAYARIFPALFQPLAADAGRPAGATFAIRPISSRCRLRCIGCIT
jgi:uncharacterized membrane protein (UPF0182 family)